MDCCCPQGKRWSNTILGKKCVFVQPLYFPIVMENLLMMASAGQTCKGVFIF
jgi:hypothetical protein